jgi:hypothetical protein
LQDRPARQSTADSHGCQRGTDARDLDGNIRLGAPRCRPVGEQVGLSARSRRRGHRWNNRSHADVTTQRRRN